MFNTVAEEKIVPPLLCPQLRPDDGGILGRDPGAGFTPPPYPMRLGWWEFSHHLVHRPHVIGIVLAPDLRPAIFQHHSMIF